MGEMSTFCGLNVMKRVWCFCAEDARFLPSLRDGGIDALFTQDYVRFADSILGYCQLSLTGEWGRGWIGGVLSRV